MARLLRFCAVNGLSGLEGLVGIPGSVGGAVAMNAVRTAETCKGNIYTIQAFVDNTIQRIALMRFHNTAIAPFVSTGRKE